MAKLVDVIRPGTTRGLDFVVLEELQKRTGISPNYVLKFAFAENSGEKDTPHIKTATPATEPSPNDYPRNAEASS